MKDKMRYLMLIPVAIFIASCATEPEYPNIEEATKTVLSLEKDALAEWSAGNPGGFPVHMAEDVTYFDDIGAHHRKNGLEEAQAYLSSLDGMVPPHDYELVDPMVQVYENTAVLTFHYQASMNGQKGPPWKATSVYHLMDSTWKMVHAHWSLVEEKPAEEDPPV